MESPILKQIVKFLQTRKKQKQWMVVFVFMAVIVGVGTVTALKMMGQAMTRKEHVLDCQLQVHQHTKDCYDGSNNLVCGYADYVVHKHNDDCYNSEGKLVCRLPEVEKHEHTKKCYEKTKTLVCGQEESAGHEHTDGCYTTQKGALDCKKEEHQHNDGCYDEEGNLVCGMEDHQHNDDCYKYEDVLTCKIKEGEGGHKHTDKCYDVQEVLTCGKLEMHKHTDKCFEKIDKNGKDEPENLKLVCKKTELLEHTHTEDAGCLRTVDAAEADVIQAELDKEAEEAALDKAAEEGREIFTTDMNEEEENGEDAGTAEGEEGEAAEGEDAVNPEGEAAEGEATDEAEPETYEETKTYEGLGYIVTASYNKDANIPEEAKFVAERITKESDEEDYKKHEEEYKKSVADEKATMSALFKIGFYVDSEEVEPVSPVAITIQFIDKNGLPEGAPIKVVHFGDDETEVIDGSKAESGSTSFKTDSFSKFGLGIGKEAEDTENEEDNLVHVPLSGDYTYEGDAFDIAFHIEGDATYSNDDVSLNNEEADTSESGSEDSDTEEGAVPKEEGESEEVEDSQKEEPETSQTEINDAEGEEDAEGSTMGTGPESGNDSEAEKIEFKAENLGEESVEYQAFVEHMRGMGKNVELMQIRTLSYGVTYDGKELDLENCDISADIIPKDAMIDNTEEEGDGSAIETFEIKDSLTVNEVEATPMNNEEQRRVVRLNNLSGAPLAASADSSSNPNFTVQYYAYVQVMEDKGQSGWSAIDLIDTSGGILPSNEKGIDQDKINIYLKGGKDRNFHDIAYKEDGKFLEEIFTESPFELLDYPEIENFNKFAAKAPGAGLGEASNEKQHYALSEVWVLKDKNEDPISETDRDPTSKNKNDWIIYGDKSKIPYANKDVKISELNLTNTPSAATDNSILVTDDTVLRLVASTNTEEYTNKALFYDYDISDGSKSKSGSVITTNTGRKGINSASNYTSDSAPRFGFGNSNTGTGLQIEQLGKYYINRANNSGAGVPDVYKNCSFGIVSKKLGDDGLPKFNVNAPDLFSKNEITGKKVFTDYSLGFSRVGDTYTLTNIKNGTTTCDKAKNLEKIKYNGPASSAGGFAMWVNDFWPMDSASSWGTAGHDLKFGSKTDLNNRKFSGLSTTAHGVTYAKNGSFPQSDDETDHNSYFGMHFSVKFELTEDYVGPLNYYFFGDDDMWVYLDDKLICDIGGCHQAAGEYVNLWDWINKGDAGTHTLRFFYTERGASGSTCWMQFTLPSVREIPVGRPTGDIKDTLTISKKLEGVSTTQKFNFTISLTDASGVPLQKAYPCEITDSNGSVVPGSKEQIMNGETFELANGDSISVKKLPDDARYTIAETKTDGYLSTVGGQVVANGTIGGTIDWYGKDDENVQYINVSTYELPETGGSGLMIYTIAGALCILLGAGFMYTKKARERRV